MSAVDVGPDRRAYHRDQRIAVESALRVAWIDQLAAPARCRPESYVDTVCWLLADRTFDRHQRLEAQVAEAGQPVERKLSDYGGASA